MSFVSLPRSTKLLSLALGAAVLLGAAGCAQDSGGSDTAAGTPLTKEELIAQGNAICAAGNEKMDAAMPDWSQGEPSPEVAQAFYETVQTEVTTMLTGLHGLTPPADLKADYDAMLTEADAALVDVKSQGLDAFLDQEEDPFAAANEIANKIGLTVCAEG